MSGGVCGRNVGDQVGPELARSNMCSIVHPMAGHINRARVWRAPAAAIT